MRLCKCGCRKSVIKEENSYIQGHNLKNRIITTETKRKISEALKGVNNPNYNKCFSMATRKKMSKANRGKNSPFYGKQHSVATREKMHKPHRKGQISWNKNLTKEKDVRLADIASKISKAVKRENNPNWKGGRSFEPYSLEFNHDLKEKIRKRDKYTCQKCGIKEPLNNYFKVLDIHHKDHNKKNNRNKNLISLCRSCNVKENKQTALV